MDQATCTRIYETVQEVKKEDISLFRLREIAFEFKIDPGLLVNITLDSHREKSSDPDYDPSRIDQLFYPKEAMKDLTIEYLHNGEIVHEKFIVNWQDDSAPYDANGKVFEVCVRNRNTHNIIYQGAPCIPLYDYIRAMDGNWIDYFCHDLASTGQMDAAVEYLKHPLGIRSCPFEITKMIMNRISEGEMCYLRLIEALLENCDIIAKGLPEKGRDHFKKTLKSERNQIIQIITESKEIQPSNYNHEMRPLLEFVLKNKMLPPWRLEKNIEDLSEPGTIFATESRVGNCGQYIECLAVHPGFNMACLERMLVSIATSSPDEENLIWFIRRLVPLAVKAGNHLRESFSITNVLTHLLNPPARQEIFVDPELKMTRSKQISRVFAILDQFAQSFFTNSVRSSYLTLFAEPLSHHDIRYNPVTNFFYGRFRPEVDDFFKCTREWITNPLVDWTQSVSTEAGSSGQERPASDDDVNSDDDANSDDDDANSDDDDANSDDDANRDNSATRDALLNCVDILLAKKELLERKVQAMMGNERNMTSKGKLSGTLSSSDDECDDHVWQSHNDQDESDEDYEPNSDSDSDSSDSDDDSDSDDGSDSDRDKNSRSKNTRTLVKVDRGSKCTTIGHRVKKPLGKASHK